MENSDAVGYPKTATKIDVQSDATFRTRYDWCGRPLARNGYAAVAAPCQINSQCHGGHGALQERDRANACMIICDS
jgi:hypothetical protein